jgi:hypothetical protein
MKTLLSTMLASVAVCALSTAPALAESHAPNIHVSFLNKSPMRVKSLGFAKTDIKDLNPSKTVTHVTQTVTFTGTLTGTNLVNNPTLLWAETWYATSSGKCIQPPKQKFKVSKPEIKGAHAKGTTITAENPCGTGSFVYFGPSYWLKKWEGGQVLTDHMTGGITTNKWRVDSHVYDLDLIATTNLTIES